MTRTDNFEQIEATAATQLHDWLAARGEKVPQF